MKNKGWIGVDLDGTLAYYEGWNNGVIGAPIKPMVDRVKGWIDKGYEVRIVTARVSPLIYKVIQESMGETSPTISDEEGLAIHKQMEDIHNWCIEVFGKVLQITCIKDFEMICLYDDRCRQVEFNTGRIINEE